MPRNKVGCGTKYFVFSFNVFFWVIGLLLLAAGIWAWTEKGFFDNLSAISSVPIDPVVVIIFIAVVMFVLCFSGCVGSLRENITLLKFFSICLLVIFFAEIIVGILSFVFKNWFHQQFAKFVNETIEKYRDDPDLQNVIDFSQEYWMCCGGDTASDWENNIYFNCSSSIEYTGKQLTPAEACGVPYSCCIKSVAGGVADMQCGYNVRKLDIVQQVEVIHTTGCIHSFEDWLKTNLIMIMCLVAGFAVIQILSIYFARRLIGDIKSVKAGWSSYNARSSGLTTPLYRR